MKPLSPMRGKAYLSDKGVLQADCDPYGALSALSSNRGILTRDFNDVTTCDVLLVNLLGAKAPSIGTAMEIAWAFQKRTPIVAAMEDVCNPHHHGMILEALGYRDEAIDIVKAILAPEAAFL